MGRPELNAAQHDEIALRIANGEGRNAIAREMGVSTWSVSKSAKAQGLVFDNAVSALTLEEALKHAKRVRAQMQLDALEEAQAVLSQLHQEFVAFSFGGKDNTFASETLDSPPAEAQLKIIQGYGILLDRALKLADHDSETGVAAVTSMLGGIAERLGVGVPAAQDPDGPPTA